MASQPERRHVMRFLPKNPAFLLGMAFGLAPFVLASGALAAEMAHPATVDDYTPAQKDRAFAAARADGFATPEVTMFQAGDFFLKGEKSGKSYLLTVTPRGKVYPSTPVGGGGA
jgi:hypothetical protein